MRKSRLLPRAFSLGIWSASILAAAGWIAGCKWDHQAGGYSSPLGVTEESSPVLGFAETITLDELREHVVYLASDERAGRFSCTEGAEAAAAYIAGHFRELGLMGLSKENDPHYQPFKMQKKRLRECSLESPFAKVENWIHFGERFSHFSGERDVELVLAGYGRDEDLKGIDIEDKLVAFFPGDPQSQTVDRAGESSKMQAITDRRAAGFLLIYTDEGSRAAYGRFREAFYEETRYCLFKSPEEALSAQRSIVIFASDLAALFGISREDLLAVQDEMRTGGNAAGRYSTKVRMRTVYEIHETLDAKNILGYIEGTDKKDEWIILTAHYDHLGTYRGEVYNGADDNGSGVAALLEIAEAFAAAANEGRRPRRTIIFLSPDAEEIGANGSQFYVENPLAPLPKTPVDVNIDSIGREDAQRTELKDFVYIYSSLNGESELDDALQKAEEVLTDRLRIEAKDEAPGSDNYIFEREGVPVIAYTTGHSRDYHTPADTEDKIDYRNLHRIARLIFVTVWEIAYR